MHIIFDLHFYMDRERTIVMTKLLSARWYSMTCSFFGKPAGSLNVEGARVRDKSFSVLRINGKSIVGAERA